MKKSPLPFALLFSLLLALPAAAATIEWNNTGTSWTTGSDWVGGTAPANSTVTDIAAFGSMGLSAMNPVLSAARSINGVNFLSTAYSYTISGSALTIGSSGIGDGAPLSTETFSNNLVTSVSQAWNNAGSLKLNGTVDLNNSSTAARTLTLGGAGATIFNGVIQNSNAGSTGNLTFTGSANGSLTLTNANTYNGLTNLMSGSTTATHDGAFGTSNISLTGSTAQLTLQGGTTNDYISNSATLSVIPGSTVNLNFVGADIVGSFVIGGTPQSAGIYNSVNEPGLLFGTGSIVVVPEPSTAATLILGATLLLGANARRARTRFYAPKAR